MGCWHGYGHGCGWLPPPEWYEPYGWGPPWPVDEESYALEQMRRRRRMRRGARHDEELTVSTLEARAEELREELRRIEQDLRELSRQGGEERPGGTR